MVENGNSPGATSGDTPHELSRFQNSQKQKSGMKIPQKISTITFPFGKPHRSEDEAGVDHCVCEAASSARPYGLALQFG